MKESQLYLNFFKKNLLLLILPLVLFSIVGFYIQTTKPALYTMSRLLEANIFESDVQKRVLLIDQAVSTTRQQNVLESLSSNPYMNLSLFKSAPLTVTVSATSQDPLVLKEGLNGVSDYLEVKYKLKVVGQDITTTSRSNVLYGILLGAAAGALCGLFISLVKTYFHSH